MTFSTNLNLHSSQTFVRFLCSSCTAGQMVVFRSLRLKIAQSSASRKAASKAEEEGESERRGNKESRNEREERRSEIIRFIREQVAARDHTHQRTRSPTGLCKHPASVVMVISVSSSCTLIADALFTACVPLCVCEDQSAAGTFLLVRGCRPQSSQIQDSVCVCAVYRVYINQTHTC